MTPIKPYLIRAVRDWAVDSRLTPHIVVDATAAGVKVPTEFVENGRMLLNIHPRAVHDFDMTNDWLLFSTRFAGQRCTLEIPVVAIRAIYARENGQGVAFPEESTEGTVAEPASADSGPPPPKKGPHLKVVK
ncbi:MAG: ClpXP protease specificity-enhancing factor [Acidiferrobacterales bacterium]